MGAEGGSAARRQGDDPRDPSLVVGVRGVLRRGDRLGEVRAAVEEQGEQHGAREGGVQGPTRGGDGEEVDHPPLPELAEEVGVAGEAPEARVEKAPGLGFARGGAGALREVKVPLLLVRDELADEEGDEGAASDEVEGAQGRAVAVGRPGGQGDEQEQEVLVERDEPEVERVPLRG